MVYSFNGVSDGAWPIGGLINIVGMLLGTNPDGGGSANCFGGNGVPAGCGTVFKVTRAGAEKVLYSFKNELDGANPVASLIIMGDVLCGTTESDGASGNGSVFCATKAGAEKVLYSFGRRGDGIHPSAVLINLGGVFYGTTFTGGVGGDDGNGTVFRVTKAGKEIVVFYSKVAAMGWIPLPA